VDLALGLYRVTPFGGLECQALALATEAVRRGHRVRLFTRECTAEVPAGVELELLPVRGWSNVARDLAFDRAFTQALAARPAELVLGFNRLNGLDVFYAADPCHAATRGRRGRLPLPALRARNALERALFAPEAATHALVLSERERQRYVEHYGTPAERLHVLAPGLRAEFLAAPTPPDAALRAELELPPDAPVVLAVGSDFRRKGLDRTLAALATLPQPAPVLVVVGAGRRAAFERRARALGVATRFVGGRTDVRRFYTLADLFVHPAREESGGTVLLEAASQGLAVLASGACGYAPLLAESGAGHLLAEPFRHEELASALAGLLAAPDRRAMLGARGRAAAPAWSLQRRHEQIFAVLELVAHAKRAAGAHA
jgi:UDP-glucose:(heptosyl)LPS alpha-1,3-glucosyltransferase